jgi:methyltransferase
VVTQLAFSLLLLALLVERAVELRISRRNAAWVRARGGLEFGQEHLVWMKLLHAGFFAACLLEVWLLQRPFVPALAAVCVAVALCAQALRYWTIATLGRRWNIAVLVLPGVPAVARGPFRFARHPNYLVVVLEGIAVPLIHSAVLTALVFSALNAWMLRVRIRCEERALREHCDYATVLGDRPRLLPQGPRSA